MMQDLVEDLKALREVVSQHFLLLIKEGVGIGEAALFGAKGVFSDQIFALKEEQLEKSQDLGEKLKTLAVSISK